MRMQTGPIQASHRQLHTSLLYPQLVRYEKNFRPVADLPREAVAGTSTTLHLPNRRLAIHPSAILPLTVLAGG